ncbi:MAG TPA: substrate-binding domain-containing protein [Myxococcales bacterium]|jgi:ABC-type phosphate transport system substrate-binding protein
MTAGARKGMILLAVLAGLGVAGAFLPVGHAEIDAQPTPTSLEIRGSGAMGQLARAVAEQFMKEHEGTIVTVQTCGAHQGLKALIVGTCGMAMGTDEVPEDLEKLALDTGVKLKRTDLYRDAIVVAVNPQNPVRNLTARQLRDIFRGTTTNWKDAGGPDAAIEVLTPSTTSAGYEVFKRQVLGTDAVMTPKAVQVKNKELRAGLPVHGIVYLGLAQYVRLNKPETSGGEGKAGKEAKEKEEALAGDIQVDCVSPPPPAVPAAPAKEAAPAKNKGKDKDAAPAAAQGAPATAMIIAQGISIDGICPSTGTVRDGSYSIVRKMSLYQRDPAPPLASQIVEHFVDPKKGQNLIRKDGNVPVN